MLERRKLGMPTVKALQRVCAMTGVALLGLVADTSSCSAQPVDPKRGHELATRLCSQCHLVDRGATSGMLADVPSFAAIAARPNATAQHLAGRIIVPHPEMPGVQLTVHDLRDIVSYIMSLKE
jgi:mono/diheme cytochrome c family protein